MTKTESSHGGPDGNAVLRVNDLRKRYDDVMAVDGVSFDVERGSVVGLLGPNGAGKTTTVKSMLGLVIPTEGTVEIAGETVGTDRRRAYEHVGTMLEGARNVYWRLTVRENLRFFSRLAGDDPAEQRERHEQLLEQLSLEEKADTVVNELSRGQKQKVSLAVALSRDVQVAFLDEPTLGLDVEASLELRRELNRLVDREGTTVILSSHDMDVIEDLCDRVIILQDGEIIADDSVENLIDVFRKQAYRVSVEGTIPAAVREDLEATADVTDWTETEERTCFHASLSDGNDVRTVLAVLDDASLDIAAVNSVEPEFEDVFLSLTESDTEGAGRGATLVGAAGARGDGDG